MNQTIDEKAVKTIADAINIAINYSLKNASYDKSVFAKIKEVIGTKNYKAEYAGSAYSVISLNDNTYVVGDIVVVTFIEGNFSNGIIIGKK